MPPRRARRDRYASTEPESGPTGGSQTTLVKPQLPPLKGTPSSRRQYTYGSGVEPPPRVGAGLRSMTLGNAVSQALSKGVDEDEGFARPTEPRSAAGTADRETTVREKEAPRQPTTSAAGNLAIDRDDDSSRSFALENSMFSQAQIQERLDNPLPIPKPEGGPPSTGYIPIEDDMDDVEPTRRTIIRSPPKPRDANQTEPKTRAERVTRSKPANTPAPERTRQTTSRSLPQESSPSSDEFEGDEFESEDEGPGHKIRFITSEDEDYDPRPMPGMPPPGYVNPPFRPDDLYDKDGNLRDRRPNGNKSLFRQETTSSSGRDALNRARQIPDDPQQRDWAIQREIEAAEAESARARARASRPEPLGIDHWQIRLLRAYDWVTECWPFTLFWRPQRDTRFDRNDHLYSGGAGPTEWSRLLYPMTYLETLKWLFDNIMDHVINFLDRISGMQLGQARRSSAERLLWVLALSGVALFLLTSSGALRRVPDFPTFPDIGSLKPSGVHWPSTDGFKIPNIIPSMSWPSWTTDDDDDFPIYDPFAIDDVVIPDDHKKALDALKHQAEVHKKALKRLETILPRIVQMDLVNGRPAIKPEFWHALQDHLKESGSFLNLEKKSGNYEISSEKQWRAIVARLERDPTFKVKLDTIADRSVQDKLPSFWDTWFKNNNDVLEPLVERALAKKQTAGSGAAFDQKLSKIVSEELIKQNQTAVSRDEFLAHLRSDFAKHESEIEAEFTRLKSYMNDHIKESIRTAKMLAPKAMSDTEMQQLIRKIIYQTLTDGSLEAVAKSKIHAHWNSDLKHQVNFLGVGAGAAIETVYTGPNWEPYNPNFPDKDAVALGIAGILPRPPIEALRPWQEEGDRWCGAHTEDEQGRTQGVSLSVQLGHMVIPENIVVEHIHPNATIDPDARPRHIEVFARFEFKEEKELVRDYSSNKFPDHINGWDFTPSPLPASFVKITQFEYQADELNDGVHVHHINDEFANLGIPTDHVIIRAVSNYGAPDHTCFYRVRLFGKRADELA